jgi:hypothetical protein
MARPLRISYPNALYHVTCRGNRPAHVDAEIRLIHSCRPDPLGTVTVELVDTSLVFIVGLIEIIQ